MEEVKARKLQIELVDCEEEAAAKKSCAEMSQPKNR